MAEQQLVSCKRKLFQSDENSYESASDYDSDDSVYDKDYIPSNSDSESLIHEDVQATPATISRGILETPQKATASRWRKTNLQSRKKEKSKIKRNLGHSYKTSRKGKAVEARSIGPPCKCKKKCRERLQGNENAIFNSFWNLETYEKQNTYLFASIKSVPKKCSYKKKTKRQESTRKVTYQYLVKVNGTDIQICKEEYLSVHGLQRSVKRLRLICKQISEGRSAPKKDERGKHHNRPNRTPLEQVQSVHDHIKAFPKYVSHYSRKKNPNRVYLDHDLSISSLYKDFYRDWCKEKNIVPVKEDKYRRIFCNEYNIGFKLPKSDTCHTCDSLNTLIQTKNDNMDEVRALNTKLELHQRKAEAMQNNLRKEVESARGNKNKLVIAFDLQQTLPTPSLTVGPAFYLRKAWTYNLGIHDCVSDKGSMFMWPETVVKRGSDEIASILLKYLNSRKTTGEEELLVFTDNCGGQNKNWLVMSLWLQLVREKKFKAIEHRFLISGHTHLPCDRDFAVIEKHKKYLKQVYSPDDWYTAVLKCKRTNPFDVIVMQQEDIFSFENISLVKKTITEDKEPVNFKQVQCFRFETDHPNTMFIKHSLNGLFKSVNVGKRGSRTTEYTGNINHIRRKYLEPIKLNSNKVANLKQLMQYIPPINQKFYLDIFAITEEEIAAETEEVEVECVDGEENFEFEDDIE